jgi:hypothetical protein
MGTSSYRPEQAIDLILASRLLFETGARQEHNKLNWDKFLSFRSAANLPGRALLL